MDFRENWNGAIKLEIQQALIGIVNAEYLTTHTEVKRRHELEEASDLEPVQRRANIETAMVELGSRFPTLVKVFVGKTSKGNYFRYVQCGNVVFTESYIEPNRRVPREAVFRNGFAGNLSAPFLFADQEAERVAALEALKDRTYVIITHTPSINTPSEPAHISAVLVDKNCKYVTHVDLIENVRLLTQKNTKVEQVEDLRQPKLRKDAGKKRETGT